jgi:hypothetical protein
VSVYCVTFGSLLSIVLLFFWNLKLILQTWREFRIAFRTKLWQLVPGTRTGRRWPGRLLIGFGALFFAGFLAGSIRLWREGALVGAIIGVLFTVALLAVFLLRFARRRLDVLGNTDQLVAYLSKLDSSERLAGIDQIAIPTDVFKEIGDIEDLHIQCRRGIAIAEFRESGDGYAVLKSRAMIADIAKLDEATRLRVETRIAELASEPFPPDAFGESGGVWRVPVTGTPYELVCRYDEAARRIELLSLGQRDGGVVDPQTVEAPRG